VAVEIKWADNWTLEVLLERLENQLVGQYLRDFNSHYGIYVLGNYGRKGWKEPQSGNSLTFEEVVEIVTCRAGEIVDSKEDVYGLIVVAIDFREPKH
jgi:hypothetical protein